MDVIEVFEKYNTDKNSKGHNYAPYYAKHLPQTATKILEIGVLAGQSILMWHEIFPDAHIFGLDLFEENPYPFNESWVTWIKGSQNDGALLKTVRNYGVFDIIIDDGSHNHRDQLMTFFGLWGCTKLYVVEDIHQEEFWAEGLPLNDNIKSLNVGRVFNYDKIKFFYAT